MPLGFLMARLLLDFGFGIVGGDNKAF